MSIQDRAYIYASSQVLTEQFPEDVHEWDAETIKAFCEENAWEPFQYWDGNAIHDHILDIKGELIRFAEAELAIRMVAA